MGYPDAPKEETHAQAKATYKRLRENILEGNFFLLKISENFPRLTTLAELNK